MTAGLRGEESSPCAARPKQREFKASTRRKWGCDATLQRAACAGARYFFRERSLRRIRCGTQRPKARPVCEQRHDGVTEKPKSVIDHEHDAPEMRADGGVQSPRSRKALAPEFVPRNMRDLLYSVMREVKTGQTRLAVYLRGWCTLRPHYEGNAPPSIKPCISTAKNRGTKEVPPRIGLFPCLPVAELGNSLEDRYVNFILGVSSYVAVGGKPVPLASFRRSTSK